MSFRPSQFVSCVCLFRFFFFEIYSVVLLAQTQKILHSDLFLIFLQLLCVRYFCFENFHSHWSFPGLAVSWGFFAVVKNCDKLNVRGELCCAAHTLLLQLHRHRSVGGRVPHFHQHVSRARGKTLYFCLFCYIFSVVFRFTTARSFCLLASSSL